MSNEAEQASRYYDLERENHENREPIDWEDEEGIIKPDDILRLPPWITEKDRAVWRMRVMDQLREEEASSVTLCNDNPDFNGIPNCLVQVMGSYTDYLTVDIRADTIEDCLQKAIKMKEKYDFINRKNLGKAYEPVPEEGD